MNLSEVASEATVISASGKVTGVGGATGLIGFVTSANWLGIGGFCIAVLSLAVNLYFQIRRDRRETRESQARLNAIQDKCEV